MWPKQSGTLELAKATFHQVTFMHTFEEADLANLGARFRDALRSTRTSSPNVNTHALPR